MPNICNLKFHNVLLCSWQGCHLSVCAAKFDSLYYICNCWKSLRPNVIMKAMPIPVHKQNPVKIIPQGKKVHHDIWRYLAPSSFKCLKMDVLHIWEKKTWMYGKYSNGLNGNENVSFEYSQILYRIITLNLMDRKRKKHARVPPSELSCRLFQQTFVTSHGNST